jgi:type IV pilus assembly protein PilP
MIMAPLVFALMLQTPPTVAGQPSSPQTTAAGQAQAAPKPTPPPPPGEGYKYNPEGRRDPFLSLVGGGGGDPRGTTARRGEGIAGMTVGEISVRGILQSRGSLIAIVQGPDNKTHLVHPGDKFADGSVQAVTPDGLVIVQEVNDPLSLVKQRVVRKPLRSLEDLKQ